MTPHEFTMLLLAVAVLLGTALILGEGARALGQPAVVGEILAGVLLGPTLLGAFFPGLSHELFPHRGPGSIALRGLTNLAVVLFMLVAGMELDLSRIRSRWRTAVNVGLPGMLFPFSLGFVVAWSNPTLFGQDHDADRLVFSLFVATAFSLSDLSMAARTLLDLDLHRGNLGTTIMGAAIFNELLGWVFFAVFLALLRTSDAGGAASVTSIALSLVFTALMLLTGRRLIQRLLTWVQAYLSWPAGVLGFIILLALSAAAFAEFIGIRAILGSLLVGVAIGDSAHLREQTRTTLRQFIACFFAPLFFASIGLRIDFVERFHWDIVLIVLWVATLGKLLGCELGARRCGLPAREAWATAFGLNARGVMLIVMADFALRYGVIRQRLFVALIVMAVVTSTLSGSVLSRLAAVRDEGPPQPPEAAP